jgi:predicted flap endonuclease-1-like 5' DNA nuclease
MTQPRTLASLLLLGLAGFAVPAGADDELARLRTENAKLKAQLQAAQCQTPAANSSATAAPAPAAAAPAAPAVATAAPAAAAATAPPVAPEGYKLVRITPVDPEVEAENCANGVFGKTRDAPWKHEEVWEQLDKQMSPAQVEALLGKVHTSFVKGGYTEWDFGKCTERSMALAMVVFDAKGLLYWRTPDF